jgi:multiple sugar transport system permease protein
LGWGAEIEVAAMVGAQEVRWTFRAWTRKRLGRHFFIAFLFLTPFIATLLVFRIIPIFSALYLSFTNYDAISAPKWIGYLNYKEVFGNSTGESRLFWQSVLNTLYYTAGEVAGEMVIGLTLALLVNAKLRGRNIYRVAFYMPVVTSTVAVSMIWLWVYHPDIGLLNQVLKGIGFPTYNWLSNPVLAMPSIIFMSVWQGAGWSMVVYLAGLQGIPENLYEAAMIDGANRWQSFRYVTLPSLRPVTLFIVVVSCIAALQIFTQIFVMTQGGPLHLTDTVTYRIWRNAFTYYRMGFASAMSFILFLIILVISIINERIFSREIN